jgi:hypothetical protein
MKPPADYIETTEKLQILDTVKSLMVVEIVVGGCQTYRDINLK